MENLNKEAKDEKIPGYGSVEHFLKDGYKVLVDSNKTANILPGNTDWNYYNTFEHFTKIINAENDKIQSLIHSVLRGNSIEGNIRHRSIDEKTELIVEANDVIFEKVANNIDEMNGVRKTTNEPIIIQAVSATLPINGSWNKINRATFSVSSTIEKEVNGDSNKPAIRLLTAKNILRPQKFFKDKINNNTQMPWEPRIKEKPNSLKPLAIFLEETENGEEYSHPYEFELERFIPAESFFKKEKVDAVRQVDETPLIEIDKPEQLPELLTELNGCSEFAVDLEHHSYRTFMGITCLLQISTKDKDYLIDTLALRNDLHVLNEVFTKPSILKIFHGADMDILWLQRDLSIYVVNLFDTHLAAKQLGYPRLSLSYLMEKFCEFVPNKQFQLADWRIRPLPDELKSYAREDTHYLIYIYQNLKKELFKLGNGSDNYFKSVFSQSTELCKKRYFKPVLREDSYLDFYRRCKRLFDNRQLYALKELYKWRDCLAREEDESNGYVLPNHMLLQISETLPREMQGILACCNPIPPLVRSNLLELHKIVLKAREQPLERAILKEDTRARGATNKVSKINVDSPLNCPHDLTKSNEFRDDLPTLLGNKNIIKLDASKKIRIENNSSVFSIFNSTDLIEKRNGKHKLKNITFLCPYERYKLVKPFIKAEEERLAAEKQKEEESRKNIDNPKNDQEMDQTADNRTVEDRMESIRQHFLTLTRNSNETAKIQVESNVIVEHKSLVDLGGSKKRKREVSENENEDLASSPPITTPTPNIYKPNRKRKSDEMLEASATKQTRLDTSTLKKQNKKKNKNFKNKQNQKNLEEMQEHSNQQNMEQFSQQKKFHQRNQNRNKNNPRTNTVQQTINEKNKSNLNKNKNPQNFTPYDYSAVDFRQFQGGSGNAQKPKEFKGQYKGKAKNKQGQKGQNKYFTFSKGKH